MLNRTLTAVVVAALVVALMLVAALWQRSETDPALSSPDSLSSASASHSASSTKLSSSTTQSDQQSVATATSQDRVATSATIHFDPDRRLESPRSASPNNPGQVLAEILIADDHSIVDAQAGQVSVAGVVVSNQGEAVAGVPVNLRLARSFHQQEGFGDLSSDAHSDSAGAFRFDGLIEGEYVLTVPDSTYFNASTMSARSGSADLRLVLTEKTAQASVSGQVTDSQGAALIGVSVSQRSVSSGSVVTDSAGSYQITVNPAGGGLITITARMKGFATVSDRFAIEDGDPGPFVVDLVLEEEKDHVAVSGTVKNDEGNPMPGQQVWLRSSMITAALSANVDKQGHFLFPSVVPASDYTLQVQPRETYQDHLRRNLTIGGSDVVFDIVLEANQLGNIAGQMVNTDGEVIPNFSLWLRSKNNSAQSTEVVGDSDGIFIADQVPVGSLVLKTQSAPWFEVRGIELEPDAEEYLDIVLDKGDYNYSGLITTPEGDPIAGAKLALNWTHRSGSVTSTASRRSITDPDGRFSFVGLTRGPHNLQVVGGAGFEPLRRSVMVDQSSTDETLAVSRR